MVLRVYGHKSFAQQQHFSVVIKSVISLFIDELQNSQKKDQILWVWEYIWNPAIQMTHSGLWEDAFKN